MSSSGKVVAAGLYLIAQTDLTGSAASIDFSGIPATFRHLLLLASLRSDAAAVTDDALLTLNNDTTNANYDRQLMTSSAATVSGAETLAVSPSRACMMVVGNTGLANAFAENEIWLYNYAHADRLKIADARTRRWVGRATTNLVVRDHMVGWNNAAAVNRLTITSLAGANFVAGCAVSLYGSGTA